MKCTRCYGKGKPGGCDKCGLDSDLIKHNTDKVIMPEIELSDLIPSAYKGHCWNADEDEKNMSVKNVAKIMKAIYDTCAKGKIPKYSAYLSGPMRLNKELFVYSCMQELLVRGFSLVPYLSTLELRRILRTSQYNPKYRLLGKWTYDDIITSDILFVTVTHLTEDRHSDLSLIQEVLDTRARLDKPTVFMSDYSLESLVSRYDTKEYLAIFNTASDRDKLKFPYVIQAHEEAN